jgi:hypothetical protein
MFWPPVLPAAVASPSPSLPQLPGKNHKKLKVKTYKVFQCPVVSFTYATDGKCHLRSHFLSFHTDLDPGILLTPDPDQSGSKFRYRPRFVQFLIGSFFDQKPSYMSL